MAESHEERLPEVAKREVVVKMAPLIDASSTRVNEEGPSRTTTSPTVESVPIPPSRLEDIASSSGATLEPSHSGSADILRLTGVPILSVAAAAITNEDISIGPITSPRASLVQPMVNQFLVYLSIVVPILLQDTRASEAIMIALESQVSSIRHFDVAPVD